MTATLQNPTIGWNPDVNNVRANGVNRAADAINTNPYLTNAFNPLNQPLAQQNITTQFVNTPYGPMPVATTVPTFTTQVPQTSTLPFNPFMGTTPVQSINAFGAINPLFACNPLNAYNPFINTTPWNTIGAINPIQQPILSSCPITGQCTFIGATPTPTFAQPMFTTNPINPFFRSPVQCTPVDAISAYANAWCNNNAAWSPINGFITPTSHAALRFAPVNGFVTPLNNPTLSSCFPAATTPTFGFNPVQNAYQAGYAAACATTPNTSWIPTGSLSNAMNGCVTC